MGGCFCISSLLVGSGTAASATSEVYISLSIARVVMRRALPGTLHRCRFELMCASLGPIKACSGPWAAFLSSPFVSPFTALNSSFRDITPTTEASPLQKGDHPFLSSPGTLMKYTAGF